MSDSTVNAAEKLAEMFSGWKVEHEQLDATMLELFQWINDPLHASRPPYSMAAERLRGLLTQLRVHFAHEESLGEMLAASHGGATHEIKGVRQRVQSEHQTLGDRLEAIIDELVRGSKGSPSVSADRVSQRSFPENNLLPSNADDREGKESTLWGSILVQFNLFYDLLEQHEEQEEETVQWLRPSA